MKLSREGKRFVLATVLISGASLNTGNNLIYLILSMMFSIIILSIVILKVNIKGIKLGVLQEKPIFANSPADINITLSNKKKVPSYSVKVLMAEGSQGYAYFPKIPGLSHLSKTTSVFFPRRGKYGYNDIYFESSFPFIFFSERITAGVDGEVIVYPEIKEIDGIVPAIQNEKYETFQGKIGKSDSFSIIREFRYGDDYRNIHWKASAKTSKLMVKEYAYEEPRRITIILDNLRPYDNELFEKAVSFAASVSDRYLKDEFFVRLLTCRKIIPFGSGKEQLLRLLDVLALLEGQDSWECPVSFDLESPGLVMLILNSEHSQLCRLVPFSDTVIYAADL